MRRFCAVIVTCLASWTFASSTSAQSLDKPPKATACHVFIDEQNIWTLEAVEEPGGEIVPILNIITFPKGEWELRPPQIHLYDEKGREARVEKFSMDTGVPDEPYIMEYLRVLGSSFIGLELIGKFSGFSKPTRVAIDLGEFRFQLQSMDCMEFEMVAEKINQINIDSPDIGEDFFVLKIETLGRKQLRKN